MKNKKMFVTRKKNRKKIVDIKESPLSNDSQQTQIVKLQSQLEIEKRARKDAEEKYKQTVTKVDVLHKRLEDKNKEIEQERQEKEEIIQSKTSLETTINKLEEYLRKKSSRFDSVHLDHDSDGKLDITNLIKTESDLEEKSRQLMKTKQINEVLERRITKLETLLKDNNISIDERSEMDKLNNDFINTELDF